MTRFKRIVAWGAFSLVSLIGSGLLFADHFTPPATGAPGVVLPVQPDETELDREIAPLLAANPGKTGALLVQDGVDAFAARAITAQRAGRSLDLQYYIWHDDLTGRLLGREAWRAAERGVRVRMLLDDMNAKGMDSKLLLLDAHPNIEIRLYNPFRNRKGLGRLFEMVQRIFSVNHRMHNKAWIADNRVAVVGGRNIGEEYFGASDEVNFRDLDVVLFGPAVAETSTMFDHYWNSEAVVPLSALARVPRGIFDELAESIEAEAQSPAARRYLQRVAASPRVQDYARERLTPFWSDRIHLIADPPVKWEDDKRDEWIVNHIDRDLSSAKHKILLISPYFVPGPDVTERMARMVEHGRTVGVVTNSLAANDVFAVYGAYRHYRDVLLRGGVSVYELRAQGHPNSSLFGSSGASLHTKAYSIDDTRGFIGSFNLDARSAYLNTEMGVMFDDPALAKAVRDEYLRLAGPEMSYWMQIEKDGTPRWLDRAAKPPVLHVQEPDTTTMQRFSAHVIGLLPLESQL
ncbi:MAG: phospholipase D family protein [Xanthomonadaceae bacterium]|nr:phospholipase D family protein [Xanthomonadaceae bacterium]